MEDVRIDVLKLFYRINTDTKNANKPAQGNLPAIRQKPGAASQGSEVAAPGISFFQVDYSGGLLGGVYPRWLNLPRVAVTDSNYMI